MENQPPGGGPMPERPASERPDLQRQRPASSWLIFLLAVVMLAGMLYYNRESAKRQEISYGKFVEELKAGHVAKVSISNKLILGELKPGIPLPKEEQAEKKEEKPGPKPPAEKKPAAAEAPKESEKGKETAGAEFFAVISPVAGEKLDTLLLQHLGEHYKAAEDNSDVGLAILLYLSVPIVLLVVMWLMFRRARDQFLGGGILSGFNKSPAKRYETGKQRITFEDVAGLEGVKHDLQEIVEFLKAPEKFQRLGGRIPKGTLLMGPPGTGKTLLAKAVAGEAGVPFFSISGSEFIQMFVGVGASRVRDMFKTAKDASPCILFIDEIDAVGRVRGAGLGGGHDEREQTLNQILSEMDGFSPNEAVIVLAATNRPDVLDPALLRPGRFDRHITVDRPNLKGREAIFKVHCRNVPLADDVDMHRLAGGTVGLTGADIRNLVNEAALWATRQGKDKVDMSDFEIARDKVLMGPKREEVLVGKEKLMTSYHESGHALLAWLLPGADRLHKVTIIPRGRALGVTQLLPEEDRMNISESELHARLAFMMGGRAAEKLVFDEYSAGAEDDLKRATQLARRMVTHWGMSERLGPVAYRTSEEHPFLGKEIQEYREFSEETAHVIDEEVARILHEAAERARVLLSDNRDKLDKLANTLAEHEILDDREIEGLIGPSPNRGISSNGKFVVEASKPAAPAAG
ncbi:MAG TPA: ATP-dependent zinc metalloprotease FtsH [Pirellulales bacterium]|nr:ATP-dependent zinc metalloprotease FtsH [Pirellulales bacterium]